MLSEERITEIKKTRIGSLNVESGPCLCSHCQAIDNLLKEREEWIELCAYFVARADELYRALPNHDGEDVRISRPYPDVREMLPDVVKARMGNESSATTEAAPASPQRDS